MKVFISWSGDRSKHIAETLQEWLRRVLQATDPWISTHIDKGLVWDNEISRTLNESRVGILCLTSDNLESTYLHYEAGAISNVEGAIVCTFLFDVDSIDVKQPLSRFQNTKNNEFDILALLRTINSKLKENGETHLLEKDLDENFKLFYPLLKAELEKTPTTNKPKPKRKEADLLEEVLQGIRSLQGNNRSKAFTSGIWKPQKTVNGPIKTEDEIVLYNHILNFQALNKIADKDLPVHLATIYEYIKATEPALVVNIDTLVELLLRVVETSKRS